MSTWAVTWNTLPRDFRGRSNTAGSSIIDTVFVCRSTGRFPRRWLADDPAGVARIIRQDIDDLVESGLQATQGDIRCIAYGHLTRLTIWNLRGNWNADRTAAERMREVRDWFASFGGVGAVLTALDKNFSRAQKHQRWLATGELRESSEKRDDISF
jgi:putative DNA methylase